MRTMIHRALSLSVLLSIPLLIGCPQQSEPVPPSGDTASADSGVALASPSGKAKAAAKALGTQLKARLKAAIEKGGLSGGVSACKTAAPEIAGSVSSEQALKIGRTSFKLRNPKNAPPAWAKEHVDARVTEPRFIEAEDGTFRALLPIKVGALCVGCHGPSDVLTPELKATLAKDYPDDKAIGFKVGELRGYFWVVVPPQAP